MILVKQANSISLCLALARLELREDMFLIKDTHSMPKMRVWAFTNINRLKILPRTQFKFTHLSNCSPANDEWLAFKLDQELSDSFAPFEKERSRSSESAQDFSRGLRESRQRLQNLKEEYLSCHRTRCRSILAMQCTESPTVR